MNLDTINELANDIAVLRLTIAEVEKQQQELLDLVPQYQELTDQLLALMSEKSQKQTQLLDIMSQNNLKSWATNEATFSKVNKVSLKVDPEYLKRLERTVKAGSEVPDGFIKVESEYISVKPKK